MVSDHVHVLLPRTSVDGQPRLDGRTERGDFGELSNNSERPVDALAEKGELLTHLLTT